MDHPCRSFRGAGGQREEDGYGTGCAKCQPDDTTHLASKGFRYKFFHGLWLLLAEKEVTETDQTSHLSMHGRLLLANSSKDGVIGEKKTHSEVKVAAKEMRSRSTIRKQMLILQLPFCS